MTACRRCVGFRFLSDEFQKMSYVVRDKRQAITVSSALEQGFGLRALPPEKRRAAAPRHAPLSVCTPKSGAAAPAEQGTSLSRDHHA